MIPLPAFMSGVALSAAPPITIVWGSFSAGAIGRPPLILGCAAPGCDPAAMARMDILVFNLS
jgi:hypothetical protein